MRVLNKLSYYLNDSLIELQNVLNKIYVTNSGVIFNSRTGDSVGWIRERLDGVIMQTACLEGVNLLRTVNMSNVREWGFLWNSSA